MVMIPNIFRKNVLRLIQSTKGRFFSLTAIVSIGVAFFVGVSACAPIMAASVDAYDDALQLKDFTIYSNYGFTDADLKAVEELDSVEKVEAAYFADVLASNGKDAKITRVHSYAADAAINHFHLAEGRLPYRDDEVLAERGNELLQGFDLGDTVSLSMLNGEISTVLPVKEVTVVGLIDTPLYLNMAKETSTLNNLAIMTYLYIPETAFDVNYYSELNILAKNAKDYNSFVDAYEEYIDVVMDEIEKLADVQQHKNADLIKQNAEKDYDHGLQEYQNGLSEYNEAVSTYQNGISDAQQKLFDGRAAIHEAEQQLEKAKNDLTAAQNELNEQAQVNHKLLDEKQELLDLYQAELMSGQAALQQQKDELEKNREDLSTALLQAAQAISAYQTEIQFRETVNQLSLSEDTLLILLAQNDEGIRQLCDAMFPEGYDDKTVYDLLFLMDQNLDLIDQGFQLQSDTREEKLYELQQLQIQYNKQFTEINNALEIMLPEQQKEIDQGVMQLQQNQQEIDRGRSELLQRISEGQKEIDDGWQEVYINDAKLIRSRQEIIAGERSLAQAIADGSHQLQEAYDQLELSQKKLTEAKTKINDLSEGKWIILSRDSHFASVSFKNTVKQMRAISNVFPAFFILVAALVCLTTMTRLVEEERSEIGTLRALGYTKLQCTAKYLFYAAAACMLGILIGSFVGLISFPVIIYHAWRMMYILPPLKFVLPVQLIILTAVLFMSAMLLTTWYACRNDTQEVPSQLMRPKAPLTGKKTLLERVSWIWNRLGFTDKVTLRNIFRYKKRFFMTVIGVAGCTALMLIGFGIRDSISDMIDLQFDKIIQYDGMISFKDDIDSEMKENALKQIQAEKSITFMQEGFVYSSKTFDDKVDETVNVHVFEAGSAENVFMLRTRREHQTLELAKDGVIISEKLAENLGVTIGDSIQLEDPDGDVARVKISAISEMYIYHYIFMRADYYEEVFHKETVPNILYVSFVDDISVQQISAKKISMIPGVEGISLFDTILQNFNSMIQGLNGIIWVLIASSMLLAFVVLSNLITVNISERQREIATLKVLGFRSREVNHYIFKENNLLAFIGGMFGMPIGIALHRYIMLTVEMEYLMFGRNILPLSFGIALVLTILFSIFVNRLMIKRLQDIRMVESLKSVE